MFEEVYMKSKLEIRDTNNMCPIILKKLRGTCASRISALTNVTKYTGQFSG